MCTCTECVFSYCAEWVKFWGLPVEELFNTEVMGEAWLSKENEFWRGHYRMMVSDLKIDVKSYREAKLGFVGGRLRHISPFCACAVPHIIPPLEKVLEEHPYGCSANGSKKRRRCGVDDAPVVAAVGGGGGGGGGADYPSMVAVPTKKKSKEQEEEEDDEKEPENEMID
eukprot:gene14453-15951_t